MTDEYLMIGYDLKCVDYGINGFPREVILCNRN